MRLVAPEGPVYQAGTLSGNPLAMAAGIATLRLLDADLYDRLEAAGALLEAGLRSAAESVGASVSVSRVASLLTAFLPDGAFPAFFHAMLTARIMLPPSQHEAWFVSAAHSQADLDATVRAARDAFAVAASTER